MKIAVEAYEESEEFAVIEVILTEKEYSSKLARLAAKIYMKDGDIVLEVGARNTTCKPDVVFKGLGEEKTKDAEIVVHADAYGVWTLRPGDDVPQLHYPYPVRMV